MRPAGLLSELAALGYEILPEGENIKLRYVGQGIPPEAARQLIMELKKHKVEALNLLKRTLPVEVWKNPHAQGTVEARRESLRQVMEANLRQTIAGMEADGIWRSNPKIRRIEDKIDRVYLNVLAGKESIEAFRNLCLQWKELGERKG